MLNSICCLLAAFAVLANASPNKSSDASTSNVAQAEQDELCNNKVSRKDMKSFTYIPEPNFKRSEFVNVEMNEENKEVVNLLWTRSNTGFAGEGFFSFVIIGYMGTKEEEFDPKKCVAVKMANSKEWEIGENCFNTIRAIKKHYPEKPPTNIINVHDIGRVHKFGEEKADYHVTIMELALGSNDKLYEAEDLVTDEAIGKFEYELVEMAMPLVEFHPFGIHLDIQLKNYVQIRDENGNRITKLIDFDGSKVKSDGIQKHPKGALNAHSIANIPVLDPIWPRRDDFIAGPEFKPGQEHVKEIRLAMLDKMADIYRGFGYKRILAEIIHPVYSAIDNLWLLENADILVELMQIRKGMPKDFLLMTNLLQAKKVDSVSSEGMVEYLPEGDCKLLLALQQGTKELVLFGKMTAKKLLKMIGSVKHSDIVKFMEMKETQEPKKKYREPMSEEQIMAELGTLKELIIQGDAPIEKLLAENQAKTKVCAH